MSEKSVSVSVGPGLSAMLTVAFVVLKLLGKIDWSWYWVLSPLWIPLAIYAAILAGILLVAIVAAWMKP